ncbi:MAG: hypothetical protein R2834_01390 [Rhodothermales bacterium]
MAARRASLQSRGRPIASSRLGRYLAPDLSGTIRQLYVQDGHVRAVLTDGSWLVFMQQELGIDAQTLALRSNDGAVQFIAEQIKTWKARQDSQASLYEVDLNGTRIVATPAALAHYDAILSRS